jgi:acetate kinase
MQVRNLKAVDAQTYVQTYGGLRGLAGESDLRYLLDQKSKGNPEATLAIESFVYGIQKVIGAYLVALSGIDALIFTATAGERSPVLRSLITLPLSSLKIQIDEEKNNSHISVDGVISKPESTVLIGVLRGDEASEILKVTQSIN